MVFTLNISLVFHYTVCFCCEKSKEPVRPPLLNQSFLRNIWPNVLEIASIKDRFSPV